jgi:hypothetical protein
MILAFSVAAKTIAASASLMSLVRGSIGHSRTLQEQRMVGIGSHRQSSADNDSVRCAHNLAEKPEF